MSENKTKATAASVSKFINSVENETRRQDAKTLVKLFEKITGLKSVMWGPSIVGCGSYHYVYDSGREGDMPMVGFSPRKSSLSFYLPSDYPQYEKLIGKLGKHKTGVGCLYVNKLADIDLSVLEKMIDCSFKMMCKKYGRA